MINVRKLAAIDIALRGPRLILAEFGAAVVMLGFAAVAGLVRGYGSSLWIWYFLFIAINYFPLLIYSVRMIFAKTVLNHAMPEVHDRASVQRYTKQQFWRYRLWCRLRHCGRSARPEVLGIKKQATTWSLVVWVSEALSSEGDTVQWACITATLLWTLTSTT